MPKNERSPTPFIKKEQKNPLENSEKR